MVSGAGSANSRWICGRLCLHIRDTASRGWRDHPIWLHYFFRVERLANVPQSLAGHPAKGRVSTDSTVALDSASWALLECFV